MEMFEVVHVAGDRATLEHFFEDRVFAPVLIPEPLRGLLRTKQVFLMTLARRADHPWEIIYMGPPYN